MEVEANNPPAIAKKIWHMVRVVVFMLRKGICKHKLMLDLNSLLKRGKLAGKAMGNLLLTVPNNSSFSCKSNDAHLSFISPREYEFSCSNSPAYPFSYHSFPVSKRKRYHHHHHNHGSFYHDDITTIKAAFDKVFEMLNHNEMPEASPLILPGFGYGRSPMVRQLRITDSPFPLKDNEDSQIINNQAEEFINQFYKDLRLQKKMAPPESPYYYTWYR
ncbi:Protein of unknown function DUF761, plant [Dillenia turbinata]|uniref:Avr9/Cf-9 rapidly elicited protein 146 n=1 Tax=Dillenia turbinata TaxID=194707 RepID=A0AAN8VWE1_9MAGN